MSGETEQSVSGWTVDTLKEHVDRRLIDQEKTVQAALSAQKEAVIKAEAANEKRFESVNEFRAQLNDQQKNLLSRVEYDAAHVSLVERVNALQDRLNRSDGKGAGYSALFAWGVAVLGVAIAMAALLIPLSR